jgi:hypothetical protein
MKGKKRRKLDYDVSIEKGKPVDGLSLSEGRLGVILGELPITVDGAKGQKLEVSASLEGTGYSIVVSPESRLVTYLGFEKLNRRRYSTCFETLADGKSYVGIRDKRRRVNFVLLNEKSEDSDSAK